jgi:hypothetical protein
MFTATIRVNNMNSIPVATLLPKPADCVTQEIRYRRFGLYLEDKTITAVLINHAHQIRHGASAWPVAFSAKMASASTTAPATTIVLR